MEPPANPEIDFICKIIRTKKNLWYINIPPVIRGAIEWKKDKLFKVILKKF